MTDPVAAQVDPGWAVQQAAVAAMLARAAIVAMVADTDDGPAVFAPPNYSNLLDRITIDPPQVLPREAGCAKGSEVWLTVHVWAAGPAGSRNGAILAGHVREALEIALPLDGHRVLSDETFRGSRPVGDPDATITHIVSSFRYLTQPA